MKICNCYHIESEQHYFIDENGIPIYENINVSRCWGTKEKDRCSCGGDKSKCNFYERVQVKADEEEKNLSTTKNVLEKIEGLIGEYWGTDPVYYTGSENKEEAGAAKLCCKILEVIHIAKRGRNR